MKRLLTALLLVPAVSWIILWGPAEAFKTAIVVTAVLCWVEFAAIANRFSAKIPMWTGVLPGIAILLLPKHVDLFLILIALLAMAVALRLDDLRLAIPSAALFLLGLVYIFGAWRTSISMWELARPWMFFSLLLNWIGDSAAYYVGRAIGKHKLAPVVSPGKTWEGAIASLLLGSVIAVGVLSLLVPQLDWLKAMTIAMAGNAFGQLGDLAESALKRGAGVKDSGTMLPGHGGWLDRVDSSLFSMPAVYVLYIFIY